MSAAEAFDENLEVLRRRYTEARQAGLSIVEAQLFADSDVDIGCLRKLVAKGATPDQIRAIVL